MAVYLTGTPALANATEPINALHPFREGNGRATREFLGQLAEHAGYALDFSRVDAKDWNEASRESFAGRTDKIEHILATISNLTNTIDKAAKVPGEPVERSNGADQGPAKNRADTFQTKSNDDALTIHPELDGAFATLRDLRQNFKPSMTESQQRAAYFTEKSKLVHRIEMGEIPSGNVTKAESQAVIELAAGERGIGSIRDGADLKVTIHGSVAGVSTHHSLIQLSPDIAVRFENTSLDRPVSQGEKVTIEYGKT